MKKVEKYFTWVILSNILATERDNAIDYEILDVKKDKMRLWKVLKSASFVFGECLLYGWPFKIV